MVTQHISKQQNLHNQNKDQVQPLTMSLKKIFNSNVFVNYIPVHVTEEEF